MSGRPSSAVPGTLPPDAPTVRRRIAVALVLVSALVVLAQPAPGVTEASWADAEYGASSTFTAATVPAPPITTCVSNAGTLGAFSNFTVYFQLPAGYTASNIQAGFGTTQAGVTTMAAPPAVTASSGGLYTVVYSSTLLGGLLGNLLGSTSYLGVRTVDANGWTSAWQVVQGDIAVLGLSSTCAKL